MTAARQLYRNCPIVCGNTHILHNQKALREIVGLGKLCAQQSKTYLKNESRQPKVLFMEVRIERVSSSA